MAPISPQDPTEDGSEESSARDFSKLDQAKIPEQIGRYRIQRVLGQGGFGVVYLARDEQLDRAVAVKVSHPHLITRPADALAYLHEARIVAGLDHPHIVPVHDVGSTADIPFYSVSKYVDGTDLSVKLRDSRFHPVAAAELVAAIAEALQFAHKKGLVHRDVKPANILLDREYKPFLVDFGLALRETMIDDEPKYVGTPGYTSPEQARGEGHRIDGRSDVFSLGVVFYELLTGKRAFRGSSREELLKRVASYEPKPPRQYDEKIPRELERICLKAIAKMASDRYSSAHDMAEDLRHFLAEPSLGETVALSDRPLTRADSGNRSAAGESIDRVTDSNAEYDTNKSGHASADVPRSVSSDQRTLRIVPKGIRSFDAHDADFFLHLVPGPHDRDGLPEIIRFWKTKIEQRESETTFSVGLIYGPSGCGKSSLVKAGLLPRLSESVISVMVEAEPGQTELRLRNAIQQKCPTLPEGTSLSETIKAIRNGYGPAADKKVLLVVDQFEQWLHTSEPTQDAELVRALRHCDGTRVQCLLILRDDFWMAITHFMRALEIRLSEGENSAAVDRFPTRHAVKVLDAFGRAFGALPDDSQPLNADQEAFLKQAVNGLADDGKVICVRLALFAETMRSKAWTPKSLHEVGGTQGVGLTFLEETFDKSTAPPANRFHQRAARNVLRELLPESGTNIRQSTRTHQQLRLVSGYKESQDFNELIEILNIKLRLITPVDPEGFDDEAETPPLDNERYFQLTHDYLVHSLRSWLTRKQQETRSGRAELVLKERAALWKAKPENRYLPSLAETARIRLLTDRKRWTGTERAVIKKATHVHALRLGMLLTTLAVLAVIGFRIRQVQQQEKTQTLIDGLLTKLEIGKVQSVVEKLEPLRNWADPLLRDKLQDPTTTPSERLRLALALPVSPEQQRLLLDQICDLDVDEFPVVRDAIVDSPQVRKELWAIFNDGQQTLDRRFQACCALATYSPDGAQWDLAAPFTVDYLLTLPPSLFLVRLDHLEKARARIVPRLIGELNSGQEVVSRRQNASQALAKYLQNDPERIVDAIMLCRTRVEFDPLIRSLQSNVQRAKPKLIDILGDAPMEDSSTEERDSQLRRCGIAGATLAHFGELSVVLPYLKHSEDPSRRSFIGHFFAEISVDHTAVFEALREEELEFSVLRMLIQSIGSLDKRLIDVANQQQLTEWLRELYQTHADAGVHSMTQWALQQWQVKPDQLSETDFRLADRTEEIAKIEQQFTQLQDQLTKATAGQLPGQSDWEQALDNRRDESLALRDRLSLGVKFAGDKSILVTTDDATTTIRLDPKSEFAPGLFGDVLRLSEDSFADCGNVGGLDCSEPFSFGCWYKAIGPPHQHAGVFSKMDLPPGRRGFDIWQQKGHIAMHLNHREPDAYMKVMTAEPLPTEKWHHVLATYDGKMKAAGARLYVNGKLAATVDPPISDTLAETIENSVSLKIGTRTGEFPFNGLVDDLRIYNRELSANEAEELFFSGLQRIAQIPRPERTADQQEVLYRASPQAAEIQAELSNVESQFSKVRNHWYVNQQQQVMVVLSGQPGTEIDYDFAMSACEVTIDEFEDYFDGLTIDRTTAPTNDCPMHNVSWHEFARYCNWLSNQDGISKEQWVFEVDQDGVRVKENYRSLSGYRMLTHAEWKHACMAGSQQAYCFGSPDELANDYVWHLGNSYGESHPAGSKLPNDFGFFDLHGNLWEWSMDARSEDQLGWRELLEVDNTRRGLFGGAFNSVLMNVQVNSNTDAEPGERSNYHGLRVVQSLPQVNVKSGQ